MFLFARRCGYSTNRGQTKCSTIPRAKANVYGESETLAGTGERKNGLYMYVVGVFVPELA